MYNNKNKEIMKKTIMLLIVCLSLSVVGNAQTKKPVRRTSKNVAQISKEPSANGKFKFYTDGFFHETDKKDYVIITAPGKSVSNIKSSVLSSLSSMYTNPSKVISTIGDNIINVNAYASDVLVKDEFISYKHYSFAYNIKIEIKAGKIKVEAPSFSNIIEKNVPIMPGNRTTEKYIDTQTLYEELTKAGEKYQVKAEEIINSHIDKIVSGLSSNSDW